MRATLLIPSLVFILTVLPFQFRNKIRRAKSLCLLLKIDRCERFIDASKGVSGFCSHLLIFALLIDSQVVLKVLSFVMNFAIG